MTESSRHLQWPFFEDRHRRLYQQLSDWLADNLDDSFEAAGPDAAVTDAVRALGASNWLSFCLPSPNDVTGRSIDVRSLCIIRELLANRSGLADVAFAMQGLGSAPISLFASTELQTRYASRIISGEAVAAFAISEDGAGSDVAGMTTVARKQGDGWVLEGSKTWISNAPIADVFVVFARTEEERSSRALSAFVIDAEDDGLRIEPLSVSAPHPIGTVEFDGVKVGADRLIGIRGEGFKIAMVTLDHFRPTVGAAALGFARRALKEALEWVQVREVGAKRLADYDLTRERLADMALAIDASSLLVYRAAWITDQDDGRHSLETSMAKLHATESAQQVVDSAVQLLGARGVVAESTLERLYREVRALRIYEGTSEIQKLIIARELLAPSEVPSGVGESR